ncbi:not available [Yersinia enterocolitica]|nr:not available [Yersinia enterocolitica]UXD30656.1 not available [Yersinia enterocolitica]
MFMRANSPVIQTYSDGGNQPVFHMNVC